MRLISLGMTAWGPEKITCTNCRAAWEVQKEDLRVIKTICGNQKDEWSCEKLGFTCGECGKSVIVQTTQILLDEIKRTREKRELESRQRANVIP